MDLLLEAGRLLDRSNAGMGVRAANERCVQHAWQRNIRTELAAALQEALVLEARQARADAQRAQVRIPDTARDSRAESNAAAGLGAPACSLDNKSSGILNPIWILYPV
jgi:hypothetical protein